MSEMDFSGFDNAALSALETDLNDVALEGAIDGTSLPDPIDIDLADPADVAAADLVGGGPDVVTPIIASDGAMADSYAEFFRNISNI